MVEGFLGGMLAVSMERLDDARNSRLVGVMQEDSASVVVGSERKEDGRCLKVAIAVVRSERD